MGASGNAAASARWRTGAQHDSMSVMSTAGIATANLTKQYPGTKTPALDNLSIKIAPGEVYGFLGSNGAGKSTTIRLLLNFLQPTSGRASILGHDVVRDHVKIAKKVGYLAGDVALYPNVTGEQLLEYLGRLHGGVDVRYRTLLSHHFDAQLEKPISQLSKGNRQKIGILQAFMHRPDVLILDEPTSGLDPLMQEQFYTLIAEAKKRGATVFLSSHSLAEVQRVCDRIGILRDGKLVREGTLEDFEREQRPVLQVTFRDRVPASLHKSAIAELLETHDNTASLRPRDNIAALLGLLSKYDITELQTRQQELEDEFLSYYEGSDSKEVTK